MALTYRGQLDRPLTAEEIDGNFAYFTGSHGITGSIGISGSIIPAVGVGQTTSSFSLGSPTAAWKDIYVSEGSIKFIKSGSEEVVLSAKDGGIQVNGGPTISADGINGQFFTSKSLDTNITVKDSNNSLLMGPIDVEENKEIVVEEDSDLTIFGDIEVTDVANAENSVFAISASYSSEAISASYASSASYADNTTSSSYALTASYALNSSCSCTPFPYSGSAVITGSLIVSGGFLVHASNGKTVIDGNNTFLNNSGGNLSVDWSGNNLYDVSTLPSLDWGSRILYYPDGATEAINWSDSSSLSLTANSTTIQSTTTTISGSILLTNPAGVYGFTSASSTITGSTPSGAGNTALAFSQKGANFFIYVFIGGAWRSASLS